MSKQLTDSATKTIWTKTGDNTYGLGTPSSGDKLPLGVYTLHLTMWGDARFKLAPKKDEDLLRFDGDADKILSEVQYFWTRGPVYSALKLPYKRGILLYGPPGTGKSSLIRIALDDVVERGGVGFLVDNIRVFSVCYTEFRKLQPNTPVVAVIEDIENLCEFGQERELLDLLDGQGSAVSNTIFIATSNYLDKLPDRIKNRPSRFDRRIEIGFPTAEHRTAYFKRLIRSAEGLDIHLSKITGRNYVEDTEGMSLAHVKELFTSVAILGADYDTQIEILRSMKIEAEPADDDDDDSVDLETALERAESRSRD